MTTEDKAQALVDAVYAGRHRLSADTRFIDRRVDTDEALCRAIEQHEAFRQEVSDAMKEYCKGHGIPNYDRFIIPAPKPDPLVEVLKALPVGRVSLETYSRNVRAALDAAGFEIREKSDD